MGTHWILRPFACFWNSAKRDFVLSIEPVSFYFPEVWVITFGASLMVSGLCIFDKKKKRDFLAQPGKYIGRKWAAPRIAG
jgi:hypothetical protein